MLLRRALLEEVRAGAVTLAFRRWRKPTVKAGGTLNSAIGVLAIETVTAVQDAAISASDARRAGYASLDALKQDLARRSDGTLYRIELLYVGEDPRQTLRGDDRLDAEALRSLCRTLDTLDRHTPWTHTTLDLIHRHPGRRAVELAQQAGMETLPFKAKVRRLKALGLTESLETGYRLSPRGRLVRRHLARRNA